MVQVETLGEIGVFFTLFVVGLEFSPERLHKVLYDPLCLTAIFAPTVTENNVVRRSGRLQCRDRATSVC